MSSVKVVDRRESKCEAVWQTHNFVTKMHDLIRRDFSIKDMSKIVRKKYAYGLEKEENLLRYEMMLKKDKERLLYLCDELLDKTRLAYKMRPRNVTDCQRKIAYIRKAMEYVELILAKLQTMVDYFLIDLNHLRPYIEDLLHIKETLDHFEVLTIKEKQKLYKQGMV